MSTYQEENFSVYKKTDVNIPMSTILFQSPIKHNVFSRNQPIKKRKVTVVTKEELSLNKRGNSIIGWASSIITKVTKKNYYYYPIQLKVVIVNFFHIYLITMVMM